MEELVRNFDCGHTIVHNYNLSNSTLKLDEYM